jgi:hypothetical protein
VAAIARPVRAAGTVDARWIGARALLPLVAHGAEIGGATGYHLQLVDGSGNVVRDRMNTGYSWKVQVTTGTGTSSYATATFKTGS